MSPTRGQLVSNNGKTLGMLLSYLAAVSSRSVTNLQAMGLATGKYLWRYPFS
jgi:hypothetical protein